MRWSVLVTLLGGCVQLFGIDEVTFDPALGDAGGAADTRDGGVDSRGDSNGARLVLPSNRELIGLLAPTGLVLDVAAGSAFDTSADCGAASLLGTCVIAAQAGLPEICVCRSDELTIRGLAVTGARALAILALRSVTVRGAIDVRPGAGEESTAVISGSAGGSYGTQGGGTSTPVTGTPVLVPLVGGARGGGKGGGAGGGALQITADQEIRVDAAIATPGGGGTRADCTFETRHTAATGGGSGGAILLEARQVLVTVPLASNGGGGSAGGLTHNALLACGLRGSDGSSEPAAAPGGLGSRQCEDRYHGGDGGDGSLGDGNGETGGLGIGSQLGDPCSATDRYLTRDGGGGGGAGRIRINTATGTCGCTVATSPTASLGFVELD